MATVCPDMRTRLSSARLAVDLRSQLPRQLRGELSHAHRAPIEAQVLRRAPRAPRASLLLGVGAAMRRPIRANCSPRPPFVCPCSRPWPRSFKGLAHRGGECVLEGLARCACRASPLPWCMLGIASDGIVQGSPSPSPYDNETQPLHNIAPTRHWPSAARRQYRSSAVGSECA